MGKGKNFQERQYKKLLDKQKKRQEEHSDEYRERGYPKPLFSGVRYLIDDGYDIYVVVVHSQTKDRGQRCIIYQAEVEQFEKPDPTGENQYTWRMYYDGSGFRFSENMHDDLFTVYHYDSRGITIKRLSDSGYAKMLLAMETK